MNRKRKLMQNTIIILIGKVCTQMITFFLLPLYTSYLISSEFGIVDLITTYVSLLVPILSLQMENSVFRFLIDARNDDKKIENVISSNLNCLHKSIFISVILFIIVTFFIKIKYQYYILCILIVTMIVNNYMQIARGLGNNILYSISGTIIALFTIIFNIIFIVYFNYGARGMLIATFLSNTIGILFLFFSLKIYKYNLRTNNKKLQKQMMKYSIPLVPNGISWWIMNASDRTIVSFLLGMSANGIYAISNKFPSILNSLFGIFNLAWSESISMHINDEDKDEYISSVCNDVLKIFGYFGIMLVLIMNLFFNFFINKNYSESYVYIPILIISSLFSLLAAQYGSIYIAKKETKSIAQTTIFSAIINIISHLVLIKYIGLYAAAISTFISYFSITVYRHINTKRFVKIKYNNTLIFKFVIMYTISFIVYYYSNKIICFIMLLIVFICFMIDNLELIKKMIGFINKRRTNK